MDIVIVVSAGNYDHCEATGASPGELRRAYPRCLLTPAARVIEPAIPANALTVGALAGAGVPHRAQDRGPRRIAPAPIARPDEPSPFTRGGFGVGGAIKPEVVEHGGNWSYGAKNDRLHRGDKGLGVVTLSHHHDDRRLFAVDRGTSMATPRVAHLAARILQRYPDASANLVRALIAHSCQVPAPLARLPLSGEECLRLVGYGRPGAERALHSTDNRVVMTAEARIQLDEFHVYEVPVPPFFWTTPGRRRIAVTLAFDPPARHRNARYLGSSMCFRLLRNCSSDEIVAAFRRPEAGDRKAKLELRWKTQLMTGAAHRDAGTLQRGGWTIRRKSDHQEGEPLHLVVVSERGW